MSVVRQTVARPLGLITQRNQKGAYPPGALSRADNLVMRNPGEIAQVRDVNGTTSLSGSPTDVLYTIYSLDNGQAFYALRNSSSDAWSVRFTSGVGSPPGGVSSTGLMSSLGYNSPIRARERMIVNAVNTPMVCDSMNPQTAGDRTFRHAGMPQLAVGGISTTSTDGGALPAPSSGANLAGYCVLVKRVFSDGYELVGRPSPVFRIANTTVNALNVQVECRFPVSTNIGIRAGDIIELYKTNVLLGVTVVPAESQDTGTTCYLVKSYTLTSTDISNGFVFILDTQAPLASGTTQGRELYTNPGQKGATGGNRQPPIAKTQAVFKGYAFYGNITERPIYTFGVPGGFLPPTAVSIGSYFKRYGIGSRFFNCTVTNGSNTITGVAAADIVGIAVGQRPITEGTPFPAGTTVTAVGATTITMSNNASFGAASITLCDVIEINGSIYKITQLSAFLYALGIGGDYELTTSQSVSGTLNASVFFSNITISIEPSRPNFFTNFNMLIRATNGANYNPPIPEITTTAQTFSRTNRPNLLAWSYDGQPEHVPPAFTTQVGSGSLYAMSSTRDAVWIWCSDGLYRLSGEGGQWRVDIVDTTCIIAGPRASTVLNDVAWAYTNKGLVYAADGGVIKVSEGVYGDVLPGRNFIEDLSALVEKSELDDEIYVVAPSPSGFTVFSVYSIHQNAFTQMTATTFSNVTALAYQRGTVSALIVGRSIGSGQFVTSAIWDDTNVAANYLAATLEFQPLYDEAPAIAKQWIDGTYIFHTSSAGRNGRQLWNSTSFGSFVGLVANTNDARVTYGVPRRAAISPTIAPGIELAAGSTGMRFQAVSLRYSPLSEQQVRR